MIFRSLSLCDGHMLEKGDLVFDEDRPTGALHETGSHAGLPEYEAAFEAFERRYFARVASLGGPLRMIASRIRLSHSTVARKLKKYGLTTS